MRILVIGANGKVGRIILQELVKSSHQVIGMVRNQEQVETIEKIGAIPVLADLEDDFEFAFQNIDAVIFTAGSGAQTGPDKTITVDLLGAMRSIDAAIRYGVERYIMVSTQGARKPEMRPEDKRYYFVAKAEADKYLQKTKLNYTIFRPGRLTDEPAQNATIAPVIDEKGSTSRSLLAKAICQAIDLKNMNKKTVDILDGDEDLNYLLENYKQ